MEEPKKSSNEFNYKLTAPFKYAHKGDNVEAKFIQLSPPTMKHMKYREPLLQAFIQAVAEVQGDGEEAETEQADKGKKVTGSDVMALMRSSQKVDTYKVGLHFIELLKSEGIALVDGSEQLTKALIDELAPEDFDGMMGGYFVNFIGASLLTPAKKR